MKNNSLLSKLFEETTSTRNSFPYLIVQRKSKIDENRANSVKKEKRFFSSPHISIELLLCERTSEPRTDTYSNSCFLIENIKRGIEHRFYPGNFIKIAGIKMENNGIKNKNINGEDEKVKKNKKDNEEHSLRKEYLMLESQNTTHYLVKSDKKMKKRNTSEIRELYENRISSSSLFRFLSSENDGFLPRTHAVSTLAFSLSSLAEAVAGDRKSVV